MTRRDFLHTGLAAAALAGSRLTAAPAAEPIIDIHQHTNYGGRRDGKYRYLGGARQHGQLVGHQRAMGVTTTILLPAGRPENRPSTDGGRSNGLQGTCTGNEDCMQLAKRYPGEFLFGANEVSDLDDAPQVIEKYLKLGAVVIGEQKFGVDCDSPAMQRLFELAAAYRVPILMHWQYQSYNYGFERFHRMLEKHPRTNFIGHAQTWWAHVDKAYRDDVKNLYPKGPVVAGGLTDRYLSDYPNMYADLSAGSGHNAFARNQEGRSFVERHQDKLLYGSDCNDSIGVGGRCSGALQIAQIRALSPSKAVERKVLYENSKKLFRL
jgi:predicted TIM-barrel fold metal-dependent hydrolase